MKPAFVARFTALAAITGLVFACTDRSDVVSPLPKESAPASTSALADFVVTCSANIVARSVICGNPDDNSGLRKDIIIGGQNTYIKLTSSNISVVGNVFSFDVALTNLIPQAIGTMDSTNAPDSAGIRAFFSAGPTSTGAGTISVSNPDGLGTFTGANQPYFRYHQVLAQGEESGTRTWQLQFSPEVANFTFQVYVSAPVRFPNGYVDGLGRVVTLNPSEVFTLPGAVYTQLGIPLPHAIIAFTSANAGIASTSGSDITGNSLGVTTLTAASGARPGTNGFYGVVCPAMNVANGTSHVDSITTSDCFTPFHPDEGYLPGTSFYGDLYRVSLTAGQTVDMTVDTGNILDSRVVIADRLGNPLGENDDDGGGSGPLAPGSALSYTATATGVYIIEVTTYAAGATGNYTLGITIH